MILQFMFCMLISDAIDAQSDNLTVQYYKSVIDYGTAEAFVYELPENAYEYLSQPYYFKSTGTYDYIIVGGGSAGAVIATRLSEDPNLRILLLEAGELENDFTDIPGMMLYEQGLRFNWNFKTTTQKTSCLGTVKKQCPYPSGKVLGGSSVINPITYVRGNRHDYDSWARAGNLGWSYREVLKFFKTSENSQINGDPGYHGKGGLLNVEYSKPFSPVFLTFLQANVELGHRIVDYNGEQQLGVARVQQNSIEGKRESASRSFLTRAQTRRNLDILTGSYVTQILIDYIRKEAYGVQFSRNGTSFKALASKEVIISAGAINSPHLLMLSGIGPKKHLRRNNIRVIKNLPVGQCFQDHPAYLGLFFTSDYAEPIESLTKNVESYLKDKGPLTTAGNIQGLGFYQTNLTRTLGVPDIEIVIIPPDCTNNFTKRAFHYTKETYDAVWAKLDPMRSFTFQIILTHPKSCGTLMLKSNNPYDYPLIDSNFLSDSNGNDMETMYSGIQLALNIVNAKAFKKMNAKLMYTPLPACKKYRYLSKAYWYCQIRQLTLHSSQPFGTCRMGPRSTGSTVVDYRLRVHGIRRLRVADSSVIPLPPAGHTNAVEIMIGEKLAYMLKNNL